MFSGGVHLDVDQAYPIWLRLGEALIRDSPVGAGETTSEIEVPITDEREFTVWDYARSESYLGRRGLALDYLSPPMPWTSVTAPAAGPLIDG